MKKRYRIVIQEYTDTHFTRDGWEEHNEWQEEIGMYPTGGIGLELSADNFRKTIEFFKKLLNPPRSFVRQPASYPESFPEAIKALAAMGIHLAPEEDDDEGGDYLYGVKVEGEEGYERYTYEELMEKAEWGREMQ